MTKLRRKIKSEFTRLMKEKLHRFPKRRETLDAPSEQGVYVIYGPRSEKPLHVGRTYRGKNGLKQRLKNHLGGQSSFTIVQLKREGSKLRRGYRYRYIEVRSARHRALIEAYATGCLCPVHLGTSADVRPKST